jgi:predicted DNA-binding transcriptional regulator AlpA
MAKNPLPESGFVRLPQILGDPKADPPVPAIFPVSRSTWYLGVKSGRYPSPVKLGPRIAAWRAETIRELIERERE